MLGVDHAKIILLSTPFPTIPMFGKNCCCDVIVFYVGHKRCCIVLYCIVLYCIVICNLYCIALYCIVLYCKSEQFMRTHLQLQKNLRWFYFAIQYFTQYETIQ